MESEQLEFFAWDDDDAEEETEEKPVPRKCYCVISRQTGKHLAVCAFHQKLWEMQAWAEARNVVVTIGPKSGFIAGYGDMDVGHNARLMTAVGSTELDAIIALRAATEKMNNMREHANLEAQSK